MSESTLTGINNKQVCLWSVWPFQSPDINRYPEFYEKIHKDPQNVKEFEYQYVLLTDFFTAEYTKKNSKIEEIKKISANKKSYSKTKAKVKKTKKEKYKIKVGSI